MALRRDAVAPGDGATADEKIDVAIAVEVPRRNASAVVVELGDRIEFARELTMAVVQIQPSAHRRSRNLELIPSAHDVQIGMPVAVRVEERRVDVLGNAVGGEGGLHAAPEASVALLHEECAGLEGRAAEEDVVAPITVDVRDGERGPLGGEHP